MHFYSPDLKDADLSILSELSDLDELVLNSTNHISDKSAVWVKQLKRLRSLVVVGTRITGKFVSSLHELVTLESLHIDCVGGANLEHIAPLTNLRELSIDVAQSSLQPLNNLTLLRQLCLTGKHLKDKDLSCLTGMTYLERLWLFDMSISDEDTSYLTGLSRLSDVSLKDVSLTDEGVTFLSGLSELEDLQLAGGQITDEGLSHLATLKKLECLGLEKMSIKGNGIGYLTGLPKLNCLMLNDTPVDDSGVSNILRMKHLSCLHIVGHKMSENAIHRLSNFIDWVDEDIGF